MTVLSSSHRKQLESSVLAARRAAEGASRAAIESLGVFLERRPDHLDANQAALRNGLRAKWRQLGGDRELLVGECAYEQWHRLLFARFLAENDLLRHPEIRNSPPVTLEECAELAAELGEPDAWSVAARFASEILPGIFRLEDPCVRLRLAPEGRHALEQILDAIPAETFAADDALGWVYQFWQRDKKDEVNASERKIGGADLGPVTQLFTENYMVRFLLENSLGAWWAARHPHSPLVKDFDYLRLDDDGQPAAGVFDRWPDRVAEVTVMDPCCGSGHFLVEAFSMLWQMRAEEEGLTPIEAQDAVLHENLYGLELDPRCVQIAMFAIALQAWKAGGRWRQLPVPNIACSGIPVKAPIEEWKALADGDQRLEGVIGRLHSMFRTAHTIGSLLRPRDLIEAWDPTQGQRSLDDAAWAEVVPLLEKALAREAPDPSAAVIGADAAGTLRAAMLLDRKYVLVATNVPFLVRRSQSEELRGYTERRGFSGTHDLATVMIERSIQFVEPGGCVASVSPQNWLYLKSYEPFRRKLLGQWGPRLVARMGEGAFWSASAAGAFTCLTVLDAAPAVDRTAFLDASEDRRPDDKAATLRTAAPVLQAMAQLRSHPSALLAPDTASSGTRIEDVGQCLQGISTGDGPRFVRKFWEVARCSRDGWAFMQTSITEPCPYGGRSNVVWWQDDAGELRQWHERTDARIRGTQAWGRDGVAVSQMREVPCTLYSGDLFDNNNAVIVPRHAEDIPALWAFVQSPEFRQELRRLTPKISVEVATIEKVPIDIDLWRQVARERPPVPVPSSDDPTQWLFDGRPEVSAQPLQVAVARLVGYRWPEQAQTDDLDEFADADGIVCLPSVAGEPPAVDRVLQILAVAYGASWTPVRVKELLEQAGSKKNLTDWLRDEFFKQHCALFANRPFVWHVWDGQRDGFSALVNYHRLDRKRLEKLTYTYLGQDWVERQRAGVRDDVAGAEARLAAALELQRKLEMIIEGEAPFDIFIRWKDVHEQPVGWAPDLNDGVRLNVRPFVEAGILRAPFNVHWKKDRGKNPDGGERVNDKHLTLSTKTTARKHAGRS